MSNVPNTSLHVFSNGETVTQDMLNQDVQVLQSAVNDNDQRITTLQQASQGALSKVPSGTAFPSNPQQGWIFFRTDIGATGTLYIYDSTNQWNSDPSLIKAWIQNSLGLGVSTTTNVISGSVDLNNYKTSGFYFVSGTVTNQPVSGTSGYLTIQAGNTGSICSQTYICDGTGAEYQRIYTGGAWSAWLSRLADPTGTLATKIVSGTAMLTYLSSTRLSATVSFTPAFSSAPIVIATPTWQSGDTDVGQFAAFYTQSIVAGSFQAQIANASGATFSSGYQLHFNWVAIGK